MNEQTRGAWREGSSGVRVRQERETCRAHGPRHLGLCSERALLVDVRSIEGGDELLVDGALLLALVVQLLHHRAVRVVCRPHGGPMIEPVLEGDRHEQWTGEGPTSSDRTRTGIGRPPAWTCRACGNGRCKKAGVAILESHPASRRAEEQPLHGRRARRQPTLSNQPTPPTQTEKNLDFVPAFAGRGGGNPFLLLLLRARRAEDLPQRM